MGSSNRDEQKEKKLDSKIYKPRFFQASKGGIHESRIGSQKEIIPPVQASSEKSSSKMSRIASIILPDGSELDVKNELVLGREHVIRCVTPEKAKTISRKHLRIFKEKGQFYIEDGYLGKPSTNGTIVKGTDIRGKGKIALHGTTEVIIANTIKLSVKIKWERK